MLKTGYYFEVLRLLKKFIAFHEYIMPSVFFM